MRLAWADTCGAVKWVQCVPDDCLFIVIQLVSNNTKQNEIIDYGYPETENLFI